MTRFGRWMWLGALLCVFAVAPLGAQQTVTAGAIEGRVVDADRALVVGASVVATSTSTGALLRGRTDGRGRFRMAYVPVGRYRVRVEAQGFAAAEREVEVDAGSNLDLELVMRAGAATVLQVDGDLDQVADTRTELLTDVSPEEVKALPFAGRNFLDAAVLAPGVSATNTASTQMFAETSAVPGQGLSVNSQRNFSNSFLVDGMSINDDAAGLVQTALPLDSVDEVQVVTAGGQAEYGRALGGYLNFVTRSGTATPHGTAYGFLRNRRMNAANALAGTALPMTQTIFGGSAGGAVWPGKTFLFANAEQRNLNQVSTISVGAANASAVNAVLDRVGYPGQRLAVGTSGNGVTLYPDPSHATNVLARADQLFGYRDTLTGRYSLYRVSSENARGVGGLSAVSAGASLLDTDQTWAITNVWVPGPRTANETRGQVTRSRLDAPVNDPVGPAVAISGVATFGTLSASPTARYDTLVEVVDNVSRQVERHALRVGADFLFNDLAITYPQAVRGSYSFSSLANFQAGKYSTFTQSFGNATVGQRNPNVGVYAQDEWHATPRLTVNAGVRYDLQFLRAVATDTNNVSPRLGLAWTPFGDGRTVVWASYGLFYDRVPLRALSNALESNGNSTVLGAGTFTTLALAYGQTGAPVFPAIDAGYNAVNVPANLRISLTTMDPHLPTAYAQQGAVEVEQKMAAGVVMRVSAQHVRGEHLLLSVNRNAPACLAAVDPVNLCRPVAAYGNNKQYAGAGDSQYDALGVEVVRREGRWGTLRASWTWSHALDDVGEFFFSGPINNYDVREDWGRSDDDQRHRVRADAVLHTGPADPGFGGGWRRGWELSGVLLYDSKLPFTLLTGGTTVQTTSQRPCAPGGSLVGVTPCTLALPGAVVGRNTGVGFDSLTVNARLARTLALGERLRLTAAAEAFNAVNRRNNMIPVTTVGSATFGQATAVGDARSVEASLRLEF